MDSFSAPQSMRSGGNNGRSRSQNKGKVQKHKCVKNSSEQSGVFHFYVY